MRKIAWKMPLIEVRFVSEPSSSDHAARVELVLHEAGGKRSTIPLDDGSFTTEDARRTLVDILRRPGFERRLVELVS